MVRNDDKQSESPILGSAWVFDHEVEIFEAFECWNDSWKQARSFSVGKDGIESSIDILIGGDFESAAFEGYVGEKMLLSEAGSFLHFVI